MRITDVRAIYPKWKRLPQGVWQSHFWQIVVCIKSSTGLTGYGYGGGGEPVVTHISDTLGSPRYAEGVQ